MLRKHPVIFLIIQVARLDLCIRPRGSAARFFLGGVFGFNSLAQHSTTGRENAQASGSFRTFSVLILLHSENILKLKTHQVKIVKQKIHPNFTGVSQCQLCRLLPSNEEGEEGENC